MRLGADHTGDLIKQRVLEQSSPWCHKSAKEVGAPKFALDNGDSVYGDTAHVGRVMSSTSADARASLPSVLINGSRPSAAASST